MNLRKVKTISVAALLCFSILDSFYVFAEGQKEEKVLHIAAVDFPQFRPCQVRIEAQKKAAEDYGVKYTLLVPSEVSVDSYIRTLINAINQDFDGIIFNTWVPEPFAEAVELADKKGIPIVNIHVPYPDDTKFISQIFIDNDAYGETAADILYKETGGKANILIMMNNPDVENQAVMRRSFIDNCAKKYPGMKVVTTEFTQVDPLIAAERLEAAFRAYPEIDTVIFLESATVTMAADIAKEMGIIDRLMIVGIDDPPDLIESIRKGEVWGSFNQNFQKEGYETLRNLVDYFAGNPFPHKTDAGIVLINKENVDTYLQEMWAPVAVKGKPYPNLKK